MLWCYSKSMRCSLLFFFLYCMHESLSLTHIPAATPSHKERNGATKESLSSCDLCLLKKEATRTNDVNLQSLHSLSSLCCYMQHTKSSPTTICAFSVPICFHVVRACPTANEENTCIVNSQIIFTSCKETLQVEIGVCYKTGHIWAPLIKSLNSPGCMLS